MVDYKQYTDKAMRARRDKDDLDKAYLDIQLQKQVDKIVSQYSDEPEHLRDIAVALANRVLMNNKKEQEQNESNIL